MTVPNATEKFQYQAKSDEIINLLRPVNDIDGRCRLLVKTRNK
jgi:hypothetical protein